jgi:hypothetical protein
MEGCLVTEENALEEAFIVVIPGQHVNYKRSASRFTFWLKSLQQLHFVCVQSKILVQNFVHR